MTRVERICGKPVHQHSGLDAECRMLPAFEDAMIASRAEFFASVGIRPVTRNNRAYNNQKRPDDSRRYASYDGRRAE